MTTGFALLTLQIVHDPIQIMVKLRGESMP